MTVALPRIRDFRGVKTKLDGRGNYTLGLSEQSIFPEIEFDKIDFQQGMDITFVTTAETDEQGYALLHAMGMPFADQHDDKNRDSHQRIDMAKTSLIVKSQRKPKFKVRAYTRCLMCGRSARRLPQVPDLPDLSPRARAARRDPRHAQGLLVGGRRIMLNDPIADMLTRIRNANRISRKNVSMPASRMKVGIAEVLHQEGFIQSYEVSVKEGSPASTLEIELKYGPDGEQVVRSIDRA